ncbi:DUF1549 domain-containing protein [Candidatus Poribacteria bacterium]|jgi:hypothetical protein|nr:DUF1549 domain-containing protein [Candidatus Poribacteria bacterium]MBT5534875.1 DUF1549 domain-containing protein [Candidatus Poribacteria bacterium]MBT5710312.1 DUF1549 domain-containing protein [Candidatus Poribacteria bacterium]MBT7804829.1 DUF1549 domain-containing protein [Candidatus Poribacteria bacterium]
MMSHRRMRALVAVVGGALLAASVWAAGPSVTALRVQPEQIVIEHARDSRGVLVSGRTDAGEWVDLTSQAEFVDVPASLRVDADGYIYPVAVGETTLAITAGEQRIELPVNVRGVDPPPVSFVREVMPAISKLGCNAGICHGSAKGKNGFKLSLRGYDPDFDYHALIQDISGRRFNRSFPDQSLMLLKPTAEVPHRGGQVVVPGSEDHRLLERWIAEGVASDADSVARVASLEVLPAAADISMPGMEQQMLVIAHYADGTTRDVTREAVFTSSVIDVATVEKGGLVTAVRRGETAVLTRYEGAYGTTGVVVMGERDGYRWVETPEYNYIDRHVHAKLQRLKMLPSELCTDAEFIRRVSLDLIGLPPTPEEVRAFVADSTPSKDKRDALVDTLLDDPEFVQHWTHKWADLLQCNGKFLGDKGVWLFRSWIESSIAQNKPYDEFVHELLTANGSTYENPAANYYRVSREYSAAVENTTQLFLGVRFSCNKCHDHPFEKWTQDQYYELGAFFADVGIKPGRLPGEEIVYTNYSPQDVTHPTTLEAVAPLVPFGEVSEDAASRREALADWLTSADNPMFARSAVNRVWSYFMGLGIIEPVDDVRTSNPPSNPELLDALTADFVESGFDLRHVMRVVARSRTYRQSITPNRWNEDDAINFSHATAKRLTAEQLLDAIGVATGSRPTFTGVPKTFRAAQLPDSRVKDDGFLRLFGRPERESVCECERTTEVSLAHAMNLINGPTVADAIIDPDGRIADLMVDDPDPRALTEELYLATLARSPSDDEYAAAEAHLANSESKAEGAQDLLWALINSPAFLFNR